MSDESSSPDAPTTAAAVDLGSNSFHMVIGEVDAGRVRIIDRHKERVALASGLSEDRKIQEDAIERALTCLSRFGDRLRSVPKENIRTAATNTFRAATNAKEFRKRAEEALGHPIDVISGAEEARLVYQGVAHDIQPGKGRRLVVDIGGSSTEFATGEGFEIDTVDSLRMGCVTFSEGFFPSGEISADRLKAATFAASHELSPVLSRVKGNGLDEVIGSSGTMRAIAEVAGALTGTDARITKDGLEALTERFLATKKFKKLDLPELSENRRPVIAGGLAIVRAVFQDLGLTQIRPANYALREGLLYEIAGAHFGEDVRTRTIEALQGRYSIDKIHAERVYQTVVAALDHPDTKWKIGGRWRRIVHSAAAVHELGQAIRLSGYHKHGAYILGHSVLPGFTDTEQASVAALVLCHRRKFRFESLDELDRNTDDSAKRLAVLLRVAVRLHRARTDDEQPELIAKGTKLTVRTDKGWKDKYPLTWHGLQEEQSRLEGSGYSLVLE